VHLNDPSRDYPAFRLDIDYPEDYELVKAIYERLYVAGRQPKLREVVHLLIKDQPELALINRSAHERWQRERASLPLNLKPEFRRQEG
jgi:spore coat polysaccharide biosynthesis protein SpsF (cytidylyltransferase family)